MALPVVQFPILSPEQASPFSSGITRGYQNFYTQPTLEQQLSLLQAQTKRENAIANLPFGGANLPGMAGEVIGLEAIRSSYGENSPQFQAAKNAFDIQQQAKQVQANYQAALASSLPDRYMTPTGRSAVEEARVRQGAAPSGQSWGQAISPPNERVGENTLRKLPLTNSQMAGLKQWNDQYAEQYPNASQVPGMNTPPPNTTAPTAIQNVAQPGIAPGTPEDLGNQYALLRQKQATDLDTRKRSLFATNIDKTIAQIDIDNLTKFSGLKGFKELAKQKALDAVGQASPEYQKYISTLNNTQVLASQIRQFYGDSIQPSVREELQKITNPITWARSPETAKSAFEATMKLLDAEKETYRDALKGTQVFRGDEKSTQKSQQQYSKEDYLAEARRRGLIK